MRRAADRELDRRHHSPQLRPAGPARAAIVGEVELPVIHSLLALPGTTIEQVRQIYSHPQALAQCDRFLRSLAGVEVVATYDTAGSAKLIKERKLVDRRRHRLRARGRRLRADVLRVGIQDYADNITRFIVVTTDGAGGDGPARSARRQDDGGLHAAQQARRAVQRAFACSRCATSTSPRSNRGRFRDGPWEYMFYLDLGVGQHDSRCSRALSHLAEFAPSVKTLGSYAGRRLASGGRRRASPHTAGGAA